mgnify:FL=1
MLSEIYKKIDKADKKRQKANKINNDAEILECDACNQFNKIIEVEKMQKLCDVIENKGFDGEKRDIHNILEKKHNDKLNIEDLKKYKYLDEKYGESLEYNKSFLDRVLDNMED